MDFYGDEMVARAKSVLLEIVIIPDVQMTMPIEAEKVSIKNWTLWWTY